MTKSLSMKVLLLTSCFVFTSPSFAEEALSITPEQQNSLGLQTATLSEVNHYPSARYSARAIIPLNKRHEISSAVAGKIVALHYVHGDVQAGEVIAEIESPEYVQMQQQLIMTLVDLQVAKQNLTRAEALTKSGSASVKNLNSIRADVTKLQAQKQQAMFQLQAVGMTDKQLVKLQKTKEIQSNTLEVVSPVSGQVYDLESKVNQYIAAGQTLIALGEIDPMIFEAYVPLSVAKGLKEGQKVTFPSLNVIGKIAHIHTEVDEITQTVDVHIQVANSNGQILKGQLNSIQFIVEEQAYQVNANALSQVGSEKVVFVKTNHGIEKKPIKILSVVDQQMYFSFQDSQGEQFDRIYIKGSTAIKSALEAAESDEGPESAGHAH